MSDAPTRIFVSYCQDPPAVRDTVRGMVEILITNGFDVHWDAEVISPPEGWQRWMLAQIRTAQFVLVVCTETYRKRFEGAEEQGRGNGATYEGGIISDAIYRENGKNEKFVPVVLAGGDAHVPADLRPYTRFCWPTDAELLVRHLTNQPPWIAPPRGRVPVLPALPRTRQAHGSAQQPSRPGLAHRAVVDLMSQLDLSLIESALNLAPEKDGMPEDAIHYATAWREYVTSSTCHFPDSELQELAVGFAEAMCAAIPPEDYGEFVPGVRWVRIVKPRHPDPREHERFHSARETFHVNAGLAAERLKALTDFVKSHYPGVHLGDTSETARGNLRALEARIRDRMF